MEYGFVRKCTSFSPKISKYATICTKNRVIGHKSDEMYCILTKHTIKYKNVQMYESFSSVVISECYYFYVDKIINIIFVKIFFLKKVSLPNSTLPLSMNILGTPGAGCVGCQKLSQYY